MGQVTPGCSVWYPAPTRPTKACCLPCGGTSKQARSRCLRKTYLALAVPVACSRQTSSTTGVLRFSTPTAELGSPHIPRVVERQAHIPAEQMRSMRQLLFGRDCGLGLPWSAWKQGLLFNTTPGLAFGLVQRQGGPCGVLAAVQAHVLAVLWDSVTGMQPHPDEARQIAVLCAAITAVLWQAGHQCSATLAGSSSSAALANLSFHEIRRTASCRSDRQIQADRDEPENALIAGHGYRSPNFVNLVMTGQAVANCFTGTASWTAMCTGHLGPLAAGAAHAGQTLQLCGSRELSEVPAPAHLAGLLREPFHHSLCAQRTGRPPRLITRAGRL
ncbi:hypothetical protein WJX72_001518 [[Myrmecia] bisecta]|uniref:Deubiquitinating enzyme MINDY-3/4 conserved domain-containing protein n=1 Tax=[Myrmecia] bisecta TaxID=41462 RepID=A0AAW1Q865_9CHLO